METVEIDEGRVDLREYLSVLRRRKWTIVLTTLIILGLALTLSYLQTPLYHAQSRILVSTIPTGADPTIQYQLPPNPENEAQVVASEPVAAIVREEVGLDTPAHELLEDLEVDAITQTQVLEIGYTSTEPELAQRVADGFAQGYIAYRREQALESVRALQEDAQQEVDEASEELAGVTERLEAAESSGDKSLATTLEGQRNALVARLGVLQQRLDDVDAGSSVRTSGGQIIEAARLPSSPSSPDYIKNAALAILFGLAIGVGLAFLRERLDDRFRDRTDIEKAVQAPVLATIPRFSPKRKRDQDLVTVLEPNKIASETYRTLRTNLQFITSQKGIRSVMVTSASAGEGKTVTSANLAVAMAQAGRRVILVSSDMRRPTLEGYFSSEGEQEGLSSWLAAPESEPWRYLRDPGIPNLRILPCGPVPSHPAELLSTPQLTELVKMLEKNADLVVFDTPPVLAVADATILASRVGGIVLVIDSSATHRSAAVAAREHVERAGGNLLGTVSNAFDPSSASGYYYSNYEYASSGNGRRSSSNGRRGRKNEGDGRSRSLFRLKR